MLAQIAADAATVWTEVVVPDWYGGGGHVLEMVSQTTALFGLFSLVTLLAHQLLAVRACPMREAAWYAKTQPTFSDALALVRHYLWTQTDIRLYSPHDDRQKVPRALVNHLARLLCYAT